jgi:hypothetical protein
MCTAIWKAEINIGGIILNLNVRDADYVETIP